MIQVWQNKTFRAGVIGTLNGSFVQGPCPFRDAFLVANGSWAGYSSVSPYFLCWAKITLSDSGC